MKPSPIRRPKQTGQTTAPAPRRLAAALLSLAIVAPALGGAQEPPAVPPSLRQWVPWVMHAHRDERCAAIGEERRCDWPGHLDVRIHGGGGTFTLEVWRDRPGPVTLPGGPKRWPQGVTLDGSPATVGADEDGAPRVRLPRGHHEIKGHFDWERPPEVLPVPAAIGVATLAIDGQPIARVRRDADRLWLARGDAAGELDETDSIRVAVHRKLRDGVPLQVTTRLELKVAGHTRDEVLGKVLLPGAVPVAIRAGLPARLGHDGALRIHVRPGSFRVEIDAVHPADTATLAVPALDRARFDAQEVWLWLPDERVRSVELSGLSPVDPDRTTLAGDWRGGPTFHARPGEALRLKVTRRGEPVPPPNRLELKREMWLDLDGQGLTVRDRITGRMHRGWRVDHDDEGKLGRVRDRAAGRDLLITARDEGGPPGVEVRAGELDLEAETRLPGARSFAAVGWDFDAQALSATLHLPPGWRLLGARGVDRLPGTWLASWTLFDFFLVIMVALGTAKLLGRRWGSLALLALVITHGEPGAPWWVWPHLLASLALVRALPPGWVRRGAWAYRGLAALALVLLLVPFSIAQVRHGIYPQVRHGGGLLSADVVTDGEVEEATGGRAPVATARPAPRRKGKTRAKYVADLTSSLAVSQQAQRSWHLTQVDPKAVVQTGPGMPSWKWTSLRLRWSGPVRRDHRVELLLLSPAVNLALAVLRVLLLVSLGLVLLQPRKLRALWSDWVKPPGTGAALLLGALASALALSPARAVAAPEEALRQQATPQQASPPLGADAKDTPLGGGPGGLFPPAAMLELLRARLLDASRCRGPCVVASDLSLRVDGDEATIEVELHAQRAAAWGLPGPLASLPIEKVALDGVPTTRLRRDDAGLLLVRLPAGRHKLVASARLTGRSVITLHLDAHALPRRLRFTSEQWRIDGLGPDGVPDASIQLSRNKPSQKGSAADAPEEAELPPWFSVHRELMLGLPWQVQTRVRRLDDSRPQLLKVPLLESERVISEGARVEEAEGGGRLAALTFPRGVAEVHFASELRIAPKITLHAPEGRPWTETWTLSCGQMWRCAFSGVPPVRRQAEDGTLQPRWSPWPGEDVEIAVRRPEGTGGQAVTVDRVDYLVAPGQRLLEARLTLRARASQGGWRKITLPERATLQRVTSGGKELSIRPDGRVLNLPLHPGEQVIEMRWQQPWRRSVAEQMPAVDLGGPAANAHMTIKLGEERWLLWATGPTWGPAVLFWSHLFILLLGAALLGRIRGLPLRTGGWLLLGLGFAQLPVAVLLVVVTFFVALRWREVFWRDRKAPEHALPFAFSQIGLAALAFCALGCLYAAIHTNLLMDLDMQVSGAGSSEHGLRWYVDRVDGALPRPTIFSLPLLVWRLAMLLWSLWLVWALLSWLPWAWRCYGDGGLWRSLGQVPAAIPPPPPGHAVIPETRQRAAPQQAPDATRDAGDT